MIEVHPVPTDADAFTVTIRVIAIDRSGAGIKKIRVLDRIRATVHEAGFQDCPESVAVDVGRVERSRFPIFVESTDCQEAVTPGNTPFPILPQGADGPGIPLPCSPTFCPDDPACHRANAEVLRARNEVLERCSNLGAARDRRNALAAAVAALLAFAAAVIAAAAAVAGVPFVGQAVAAALIIVAALAIGAAIGLSIRVLEAQHAVDAANDRLRQARSRFTEAADRARSACCAGCIDVDLTQPTC
jgi:hypothetical protein